MSEAIKGDDLRDVARHNDAIGGELIISGRLRAMADSIDPPEPELPKVEVFDATNPSGERCRYVKANRAEYAYRCESGTGPIDSTPWFALRRNPDGRMREIIHGPTGKVVAVVYEKRWADLIVEYMNSLELTETGDE